MLTTKIISDLADGRKMQAPIELTADQMFMLEIIKQLKVIRSSVGTLAFLAIMGLLLGIISAFLS